jgi:hypothetical protein
MMLPITNKKEFYDGQTQPIPVVHWYDCFKKKKHKRDLTKWDIDYTIHVRAKLELGRNGKL